MFPRRDRGSATRKMSGELALSGQSQKRRGKTDQDLSLRSTYRSSSILTNFSAFVNRKNAEKLVGKRRLSSVGIFLHRAGVSNSVFGSGHLLHVPCNFAFRMQICMTGALAGAIHIAAVAFDLYDRTTCPCGVPLHSQSTAEKKIEGTGVQYCGPACRKSRSPIFGFPSCKDYTPFSSSKHKGKSTKCVWAKENRS